MTVGETRSAWQSISCSLDAVALDAQGLLAHITNTGGYHEIHTLFCRLRVRMLRLFSALWIVPILAAPPSSPPALMSQPQYEGKGLVITTHGSGWFFQANYWRYPVFKNFVERFDFINRLELEQVFKSSRD